MDVTLSEIDARMVAGQLAVIAYLQRQAKQLENELVVALLMTYGVDVRKEGVVIDLEHGVVHVPERPDTNEQ